MVAVSKPEEKAALERRLAFEVTPFHALWGTDPEVIARCQANDDIIVRLGGGRFAIVHLVWGATPGDARWPDARRFADAEALQIGLDRQATEMGFDED